MQVLQTGSMHLQILRSKEEEWWRKT